MDQKQPPKLKIEHVAVGKLKPYAKNSRLHSDAQIQGIAASIRRFGFTAPILVRDDYEIIAGHGRLEGAKLAGLKRVPIIKLGHLSPEEARAYLIADNRLGELATWDEDLLRSELRELNELEISPGLDSIGYDEAALAKLIAPLPPPKEKSRGGKGGLGNPVISYTLVFDTEEQQAHFYRFLRWLRAGSPGDTIATRLDAYLESLSLPE